jgi:DNA-binding transcriptional regulator YiaG
MLSAAPADRVMASYKLVAGGHVSEMRDDRQEQGVSQEQYAAQNGMTTSTVANIEQGSVSDGGSSDASDSGGDAGGDE